MTKRIVLIVVLMAFCVLGITSLQLYWNYRNYLDTVSNFRQHADRALVDAVNSEMEQRHQKMVDSFKHWMSDTLIVQITCENNNRKQSTVFHMKDTHPLNSREKGVFIGIRNFKQSLAKITPQAKRVFIHHFSENIVRVDLKKGIVYNYTQQLGERLLYLFDHTKMDTTSLKKLFRAGLSSYGISGTFTLNPDENNPVLPYRTKSVNTALRRPYEEEMVWARIQSPNSYFFAEMKWILIGSLLLISITICCFVYTAKTLLSQHHLTVLKNSFINNMTHEINTPIASILVTVQSLQTFEHERELQLEFLGIIEKQGLKLKSHAAQILELNSLSRRAESGFQPVELNILMQKGIEDMQVLCNLKSAAIVFTSTENPIFIDGNQSHLINAFTNLIDNALKYNRQIPKINIHLGTKNGMAVVVVSDNGIGIRRMYHRSIFEEFFRVPSGNLHEVKGYGLGLTYVAQVIKGHNGEIIVTENKPGGSIFTLKFPLK